MSKRMLIDASHPEETRVVILSGNRVEEFDFESASRKPLKGNIYLAKVTRVEPSLQAAFIEYGGNRHGFLAFSEIHPDYYQIPVADRQALLAAQRADERSRQAREDEIDDDGTPALETFPEAIDDAPSGDAPLSDHVDATLREAVSEPGAGQVEGAIAEPSTLPLPEPVMAEPAAATGQDSAIPPLAVEPVVASEPESAPLAPASVAADSVTSVESDNHSDAAPPAADEVWATSHDGDSAADGASESSDDASQVEEVIAETTETEVVSSGADDSDDFDDRPVRAARMMRHYKIQEVIKKRQILLIQVVKEERGNKGAALTTYLSLAGRYCVLMPNSGRGGGISRKITNSSDRRRLKQAAESLDVPDGMGLIVRTAGASRTKQEIERDFEYLLRLWDSIRELTLRSSAPALVYEEGNLIKRAIRDQFTRDIEEIVVEGQDGFDEAQSFTQMLMPAQSDAVTQYGGATPLFQKYRVESQLDSMFNPRVQLKSGGYLIINQTEALVAIDVNSGRSTREHNIEDTAHKTNLEAAEEVARQLRLRDLAGLIVIDFIDMEENRNDRAVERRLKECLRHDRARIQIGRISPFGLLEMSRQRLRPGMVEGSTVACPHCSGTGLIRSVESLALRALRQVEEEASQARSDGITLKVPTEVAVYILNHKRVDIAAMEDRLSLAIFVDARGDMFGADCAVEVGAPAGLLTRRSHSGGHATAVSAETALALMPAESHYEERIEDAEAEEGNIEEVGGSDETERPRESREGRDRGGRRRRRGRSRDDRSEDRGPRQDQPTDPLPVIAEGEAEIAAGDGGLLVEAGTEGAPAGEVAPRESTRDGNDRRRRRRGRRGGRRNGPGDGTPVAEGEAGQAGADEGFEDAGDDGDTDGTPVAAAPRPAMPDPDADEFDTTPAQASAGVPRSDRKSPAAAIARFFGFGKVEREEQPAPAVIVAAPEVMAPTIVTPQPAPIAPAEASPVPESPAGPEPVVTQPPEPVASAPEPEPTPTPAPVEAASPEPATAPEPEPHPSAEDLQPAVAAEPVPTAPLEVAPELVPQTQADEKVEIVTVGPSPSGPAKAGWWKKRDA